MKANYLRAVELIKDDSWRAAIPCLKAAGYYSNKKEGFNQLSRYWLAEAYFRSGKYDEALALDLELYNSAALYGTDEAKLLSYNIAYAYFQKGEYASAAKWFDEHISTGCELVKKEALVRLGDCFFQQTSYATALKHYLAAYEYDSDINDIYPYYYAGLAYGLIGRNQLKISTLEPVLDANVSADFYPEALCELGVTYSRSGDETNARRCFNQLIATSSNTTFQSMALIELGTIAMNNRKSSEAKTYYKRVVEQMPVSTYTDDALLALESVYRSENDPQGYLDYLDSIGKASSKSSAERDEMIFNAAEQVFISGNYSKALSDFQDYLAAYPSGERRSAAEFYIAESYRLTGSFENAIDNYALVIDHGYGSFLELALVHYSDLSYKLQHYSDAYSGYEKLHYRAQIDSNKYLAQLGMMRSAYNAKLFDNAVSATTFVLNATSSTDAEKNEATYIRAKSFLGMSNRERAIPLLELLAENPSNSRESEAAFLVIQDCYDRADFAAVEEKVFAFSDAKNPDEYWLAKSFVVLGDAYAEQGELEQAKATFESVRDGYDGEDDVKDDLDLRIRKIEQALN